MNTDDEFNVPDDVLIQKIGGEAVLLHLEQQEYYGLNEVGTRIWELLTKKSSQQQMIEIISSEFDVSKEIAAADIDEFLEQLKNDKLITSQTQCV